MKYCLVFLFLLSCRNTEEERKKYAQILANEECNLVISSPPFDNSVWFKTKGYDPITQEPKICKTNNRWWNMFALQMDVGDTIVKKKGELIFAIHKTDTIIYHDLNIETAQ